jgi:hypothetical protein
MSRAEAKGYRRSQPTLGGKGRIAGRQAYSLGVSCMSQRDRTERGGLAVQRARQGQTAANRLPGWAGDLRGYN